MATESPSYYADLYAEADLYGGHVILLSKDQATQDVAREALRRRPNLLQGKKRPSEAKRERATDAREPPTHRPPWPPPPAPAPSPSLSLSFLSIPFDSPKSASLSRMRAFVLTDLLVALVILLCFASLVFRRSFEWTGLNWAGVQLGVG